MDSSIAEEAQDFASAMIAEFDHLNVLYAGGLSTLDADIERCAKIILHAYQLSPRLASLGYNPSVYLAYRAGTRAERLRIEQSLAGAAPQPVGIIGVEDQKAAGRLSWAATLRRRFFHG